jgi:hypothetical protein
MGLSNGRADFSISGNKWSPGVGPIVVRPAGARIQDKKNCYDDDYDYDHDDDNYDNNNTRNSMQLSL